MIPNARDTLHGIAIVPKEFEEILVVGPKMDMVDPIYLYHILRQPSIIALLRRESTGEINRKMKTRKGIY